MSLDPRDAHQSESSRTSLRSTYSRSMYSMSQQHHHRPSRPGIRLLCALVAALATGPAFGEGSPPPPPLPGPECTAPVIPTEALDEARANTLREGLNQYKLCIQQYVEKHQAEAQRHQQAANGAVNEFNAFIRKSFPKPEGGASAPAAATSAPPAPRP